MAKLKVSNWKTILKVIATIVTALLGAMGMGEVM